MAAKEGRVFFSALLTAEKRPEVGLHIRALLRDVEITGELVREFPTRFDDGALGTHTVVAHQGKHKRRQCRRQKPGKGTMFVRSDLKEKFLGVLSAVAEVDRADVVVPATGRTVQMHEIGGV